jgi:homoserine dehydrogenase
VKPGTVIGGMVGGGMVNGGILNGGILNVGIIGFGTVGSGTAKILIDKDNAERIRRRTGADIRLKHVADLDIVRDRGIALAPGVLIPDANVVLNDPEIDVVVELMGGIHPALEFIMTALNNGKHVVTANKQLLAEKGAEIFALARRKNRVVAFEAAVAGGIPIIKVLREGLAANNIRSIHGIINGTSNYILTRMTVDKMDFQDALKEAQRLGYAEANPAFDVEGVDTAHKLTLLASLAFGIPLSFDRVFKEGITRITAEDILYASELGYKIKLLAVTKVVEGGVELRVHPTMIPEDFLIAKVDGVLNAVMVVGDYVGETMYYGRGAGDMPTGSAVVSDIIDIATGRQTSSALGLEVPMGEGFVIRDMKDVVSMYYFRFSAIDKPGVLSKISGVLGGHNISISAVIQKERREGEAVPVVVLTHKAREEDVIKAVGEIDKLNVVSENTRFIRVEGKD